MDKFESLRAFTQVVKAGGFAAAARELGLSRSTVNKLVIALENELGVQLFHRSTRQVVPTAMGQAFYDRCLTILSDLDEAERSVSQLQAEPKGRLRINAPMTFGTLHLAPAIAQFMGQYPDLEVQLTLEDRLIDPLEEGYDLVVRIGQPPASAVLSVHPLATIQRILCAAPAFLARYPTPTHPQDLREFVGLHYGAWVPRPQWQLLDLEGKEYSLTIRAILFSNNGEVLREAAVQGLGLALLPTFIIEQDLRSGRLRSLLCDYRAPDLPLSLLSPANRHLSTKVRLLIAFLTQQLGQDDSFPIY